MHKGRLVPARVETVVLFLPDVWSCLPTRLEWEQLVSSYRQQLTEKTLLETKEDTQAQHTTLTYYIHIFILLLCFVLLHVSRTTPHTAAAT